MLDSSCSNPQPILTVAAHQGLRRSELLGLRWADTDLDTGMISIKRAVHRLKSSAFVFTEPKTAKSKRRIKLTGTTVDALRHHRAQQAAHRLKLGPAYQEQDLVFPQADGGPMDPSTLSHGSARILKDAGLPHVRMHEGTRHTMASIMLADNVHPKIVQERLGHSSTTLTMDTYSHVLAGLADTAVDQFDEGLKTAATNAAVGN